MKTQATCSICSKKDLIELINMPKMPLTGLFLKEKDLDGSLFDQAFNYCKHCGHGQLKNVLPQEVIYDDSYDHRTSKSQMSRSCNEVFLKTINSVTGDKIFNFATGVSLLLFYAFAMQCVSTLAIVKKETNSWKWPIIQLVFMSGLAYLVSLIAYQVLK